MRDFCVLVVIAALGLGIGAYMEEGRTDEQAAPAASPAAEGTGYLPAQLTNQAKDVEPLPATF